MPIDADAFADDADADFDDLAADEFYTDAGADDADDFDDVHGAVAYTDINDGFNADADVDSD